MAELDVTFKDTESESLTVRESAARSDSETTFVYGAPIVTGLSGVGNSFRGWNIIEQLPTQGAEADIFIADVSGERRVLKLYRHRLEPKIEILNRITNISRENSRCFVTYYDTGFDETTGRWYELQEYIQNGSVKDLPWEIKRSQNFISQFIPELTAAIQCLHDNGIIHCDIKPANVLVRTLEPLDLVLADFGISSLVASDMSRKMTSLKGTPMYWAPEAFSRVVGWACDWWGLGMMILEMLIGKHPFEGMNDSRIIRELTLGNVTIPESVGADWSLPVKGLLTKDDTRRWGNDEVTRWLAGDRDIPVFYESTRRIAAPDTKPFRFSGLTCRTLREIAEAIASNEEPWTNPADYLRYIRRWCESNFMLDEAARLGEIIEKYPPETGLFRFVHANAALPFCLLGHETGISGLSRILGRAASGKISEAEGHIIQMLDTRELEKYYEEYAAFGETDMSYIDALYFLFRTAPAERAAYAGAIDDPGGYLWPGDIGFATWGERLACLKTLGERPITRKDFDETDAKFIIPDELKNLLKSQATYKLGASKFRYWRERGLFLEGGESLRKIKIGDYEHAARILNLGHTEEKLSELDYLIAQIGELSKNEASYVLTDGIKALTDLRDKKMSGKERV